MPEPLTFPTLLAPSDFDWHLIANTQQWTSPLSGASQTQFMPGQRWYAKVQWSVIDQPDWRALEPFLWSLAGAAGRFYYGPLHAAVPRGVGTGSPQVNGNLQSGRTLITDGWTPSTANILRRGDYFSMDVGLGRELKCITADASSDSSGNATLVFEPPLRSSPADNAPITVNNPTCVMRLKDDSQGKNMLTAPVVGSLEFEMIEAF